MVVGLRDTLEPDPDNTGVGSFSRVLPGRNLRGIPAFAPVSAFKAEELMLKHIHSSSYRWPVAGFALTWALCAAISSMAQQNTPPGSIPNGTSSGDVAEQKKLPVVKTTVVVEGKIESGYLAGAINAGTVEDLPVRELPLSAVILTRSLLDDQNARQLQDVIKNDASAGEDYAPVGYYGVYQVRGYPLDLATALEINGINVAGEQEVMLENKEAVEILKGIAGIESGVSSAGGLINFVTRRPALIEAVDAATDHRGTAYGAADLGRFFGAAKQVGARVNVAGEHIESYITDADGWRGAGAGAADWKFAPHAIWKNDFEYQHKVQRSECGYQLLGGNQVPEMSRISPSTMLGAQSWQKPNTFDTYNAISRLDVDLPKDWHAMAEGAYSHSLIDDNVIYAYGSQDANYNSVCSDPTAPGYYFCPDGTYAIFDYRNPGERRINANAEALLAGGVKTGLAEHNLALGGSLFRRSVEQPRHSVNHYLGTENIYQPIMAYASDTLKAPERVLDESTHQSALIVQDRVRLPGHIQLLAGGRADSVRDHNYKGTATDGTTPLINSRLLWLPQYAVTVSPVDRLTLYGNYAVMLSLGPQAPWWTDNGSAYLAPYLTRQVEVGAKLTPRDGLLITAALYHMRAPFFYPMPIATADSFCASNWNSGGDVAAGDLCFESRGHETHNGAELSATGRFAQWLRLNGSATFLRATSNETGTASYEGRQVLNTPRSHATFFADLHLPRHAALSLMPGWSYTSSKDATRDDSVRVGGYNLFNLGMRYQPGGEKGHMTVRLYADNITDKRYWKDTGANYGDAFLHLGAPTTVRMSAHYVF